MYEFLLLFILFLIYSIFGYLIEMVVCGIEAKKIVDRGFLIGPYCPIYGISAITMILGLKKYSHDLLVLFIMSVIICSIMEYITSYLMEKIFKARWWDYSHMAFNINGRICLSNSIMFGLLGVLLIHFINPFVFSLITKIPNSLFIILVFIILIIFIIDVIVSFNIINKIKVTANNIKKDNTEEITAMVKQILANKSYFSKRILKAFPNFKTLERKLKGKNHGR